MTPPKAALQIDKSTDGHIAITGELDAATAPQLRAVLAEAVVAGSDRLVLDVSGLRFCASTGLAVLVCARCGLPTNGQLILHGASDQLRRLLRITHLDTTFTLT